MIKKEEYEEIYQELNRVSPIEGDCGRLCQAACCQSDSSYAEEIENKDFEEEAELGMYLLPGEEALLEEGEPWLRIKKEAREDYDFPDSWPEEIIFAACGGPAECRREKRPIQCRSFPLYPHLTKSGELQLIYCDFELPYLCPLIEEERPLQEDFILATYRAWERLLEEQAIYDLIKMDSEAREEVGMGYRIAYPQEREDED